MSAIEKCPKCDVELPPGLSPDECPRCLLGAGMGGRAKTIRLQLEPDPRRHTLSPGQKFGHYHIVRVLGEGGMGRVYEAEDLDSRRCLALKVLSRAMNAKARKRFLQEGRLAARINHPNSVYVFGTEEIEGEPVISMELMPGGTLSTQMRAKGPLPVDKAVDAILDVIAGLEAALDAGILHLDIKPSNCFVASDGTVKIGDFGLSMSTEHSLESELTEPGAVMGTLAYASPEQLRADELDVRSDIYAVGVTLYQLLSGHLPFDAENQMRLIAMKLEDTAESPARFRAEIPAPLCRIVLQTIERQPAARPGSYQELRQSLLPFSSQAIVPASLGLRFLAWLIDSFALSTLNSIVISVTVLVALLLKLPANDLPWRTLVFTVLGAITGLHSLYWGLAEGLLGSSPGKMACGIRLIRVNRESISLLRAWSRAAIMTILPALPVLVFLWFELNDFVDVIGSIVAPIRSSGHISTDNALVARFVREFAALSGFAVASLAFVALLFVTMRSSNGFAAAHDLLTGIRVVMKPRPAKRPNMKMEASHATATGPALKIGPYEVLEASIKTGHGEVILAYDAQLLRKVWVRKVPVDTPAVPLEIRNLARPGRLRWLNGTRMDGEAWDAYEATKGRLLSEIIRQPQSRGTIRFWLFDLAEEINAGLQDRSLPALRFDRVWITSGGRAKLLDFPILETAAKPLETAPERFMCQAACASLTGQPSPVAEINPADIPTPLPVYIRGFLEAAHRGLAPEVAKQQLQPLLNTVGIFTRARRVGIVSVCSLMPVLGAVICLVLFGVGAHRPMYGFGALAAYLFFLVAIPTPLAALLFRGGLVMFLFGAVIVRKDGSKASRFRVFWRSVITIFPIVIAAICTDELMYKSPVAWTSPLIIVIWTVVAALAVCSTILPARSWQDRMAGTYRVSR